MTDFYVDFSLGSAGAGTFASPWNRLSGITGVTSSDFVWCRRTTFTDTTLAANYASQIPSNVPIIGWPIVGDSRYAARPAAAQAAWDGDAGTHATITHNPLTGAVITNDLHVASFVPLARTYIMSRFKIRRNCVGTLRNALIGFSGTEDRGNVEAVFITERCAFEINQNTNTASDFSLIGNVDGPAGYRTLSITWTDVASTFLATGSTAAALVFANNASNTSGYGSYFRLIANYTQSTFTISARQDSLFMYISNTIDNYAVGSFDRVTISHTTLRTAANFWYVKTPSPDGLFFSRCIFTCIAGGTNGFNRFDTHNFTYYECDFINYNAININDPGARLSIRKFVQGAIDSSIGAIHMTNGGNYVTVGYASFVSGTFRDVFFAAPYDGIASGTVHFRSVAESGSGYALNYNARVIAQNINGAIGTYKRTTLVGVAQSVAGYRTGGARYAIQLQPALNTTTRIEGCPTEEPGFETLRVALAAGTNTVTIYGAHVGYATAPNRYSVWGEIEAPMAATRQRVSTRQAAAVATALTADTSNWNGVSGSPTFFKLVLTVVADTQCVASVRVYAGDGNGSVFVDPKAVVS